jgi:oxygen-independent coproporphyrinogen III oxidase
VTGAAFDRRPEPESVGDLVAGSPYRGYLYSYPHKTSYRPLGRPVTLREAWSAEDRRALFLYLHVPFCEMRCGFCNLFTRARPRDEMVREYLAVLRRQAARAREAVSPAGFARLAVGGGTPTYLDAGGLEELFDVAEGVLGADLARIPISVETSPETAVADRLAVLRARGTDRVSIGVQSFVDAEVRAVGRAQSATEVDAALDRIRAAGFPVLNVDLMYGLPGQTEATWLESLERALRFAPEELYLYPLYVRPLTGLARRDRSWDDQRLELYRLGRDLLRGRGYEQISMRMFRAASAPEDGGPVYCCQEDGMLGLGAGARSYTDRLHYSTEYAVGGRGVLEILRAFLARADDDLDRIGYGVALDEDDRRRRYAILSLLQRDGLDLAAYRRRFAGDALEELPELSELERSGLARRDRQRLVLTEAGVERADAIGPWLHSRRVSELMARCELR